MNPRCWQRSLRYKHCDPDLVGTQLIGLALLAMTARRALYAEYKPLVRRVADALMRRMPASVERDDLEQEGAMGLLEAAQTYEAGHDSAAAFATFATHRIRGAMLDHARSTDPLSRDDRLKIKRMRQASDRLQARGNGVTLSAIALDAGLSLDDCVAAMRLEHILQPGDFEAASEVVADTSPTPEQHAEAAQKSRRLAQMPHRWQQVATGVLEGDALAQIGERLDPPVSDMRVSQMLRQIILYVEGGDVPWRIETGQPAGAARPTAHAVAAVHALQAVQARATLREVIDTQRKRLAEIDAQHLAQAQRAAVAARIAQEAADAWTMYTEAMEA